MASYLSPRKLLSKKEYKQYQEQQQIPRRAELQQKIKQGSRNLKRFEAQQKYSKTRTGRFGSALARGIQAAQRPRPLTTASYSRQIPITSQNVQQEYPTMPRTLKGTSGGRVGRPRGTYDRRYAQWGGIYGFRKAQAAMYRERRLQLQRQYTVSPQQQMLLNQAASSEQAQRANPEGRIIPSTGGQVPLRGIMFEIDQATRIID